MGKIRIYMVGMMLYKGPTLGIDANSTRIGILSSLFYHSFHICIVSYPLYRIWSVQIFFMRFILSTLSVLLLL